MTLQAGPPPAISISQINTELGLAATTTHDLDAADMRVLAGIAAGAPIGMASFYGKTRRVGVYYTLASNAADGNMRNAAIAAGWDQVIPIDLTVTINGGVYCYGSSTGVYALLSGTFPANSLVKLINNGGILGAGGVGGAGAAGVWLGVANGNAGAAAGPGFCAQQAVTVTNNSWIAAGGGGGGSGGTSLTLFANAYWSPPSGGGGGGRGGNNAGGGAGANGVYGPTYPIAWTTSGAGGDGNINGAGAGSAGVDGGYGITAGNGGNGGDVGGAGGAGAIGGGNYGHGTGGAGGASNNAIVNNGYISWVTVGARYGGIV
jgi:hypothetical protein